MSKIIKAVFTGRFCKTQRVFQFDTNDQLQIVNLDLPANYTVDFANSKTGESVSVLATSDTVQIPPDLFVPGSEIYAWVWISDSNGGYTRCEACIPIDPRARRTETEPTPAQASAWDEAVDTLNETVDGIPSAINSALQEAKDSGEFDGADGLDGNQIWWTERKITVSGGLIRAATEFFTGGNGTPKVSDYVIGLPVNVSPPGDPTYLYSINMIAGGTAILTEVGSLKGADGGGGTSDYSDLFNKPQINSNTLTGNQSAADLGLGTYSKPSGGIPKSDLASAVQTSLGKADTALQSVDAQDVINLDQYIEGYDYYSKPSGGIPASDLAAAVQTSLGKADTALQSAPVTSVNGQTGAVTLSIPTTASDVGAIAAPFSPTSGDVLTYNGSAWAAAAPAHQIPAGGNAGECLAKTSATDYDLRWRTINDWTPAGLMRTNGGTAAKVAEWSFWSATQSPAWLVVTVCNSNTHAGAITLKVNGSTAYPIYINGAASSATNYTLPAGSYFVYFDGSKFDFRTDGKIPGDIIGHADKDIQAPASPTTGDFLCWNGSAWAATTLSAWQGGNY